VADKLVSWYDLTNAQKAQVKEQFIASTPSQNARSRYTIGDDGKVISREWTSGLVTRPMVRRPRR
jgi:hypothetical protein